MTRQAWRTVWVVTAIYVGVTAVLARDVLANLGTHLIHDEIDPLLIAGILQWNATHLPFTDAWWQFPIFFPSSDVLAFSEHLLGVSVIAAPLAWATGDPIVAANLTALLTFPLCALAAFLLARHLTGSDAGAFVAGLVYGFGPYRMSQLSHLQMLAIQWVPLAMLALHLYRETARRRWLVLLGVAWLLQALSNGYALFILSVFVGLWLLWFVVPQRRWRLLVHVALTLVIATIPLVPILWKYLEVHARNGFSRAAGEVAIYSADAAGFLCAPFEVSLWGWLQYGCRAEGQLFPGLVTAVLSLGGVYLLRERGGSGGATASALTTVRRLALAVAVAELASALVVALNGPWAIELGPLSVHASEAARPFMVALLAAVAAFALSPSVHSALSQARPLGFYVAAGAIMWWCALGPAPAVFGQASELPGPFTLLTQLPGFMSLRVPARFWLATTLCLSIVAAFAVAELSRRLQTVTRAVALCVLSLGVLSDGWEMHLPFAAVPAGPPNPGVLRGERVLYLPAGNHWDVIPTYFSVVQGWTAVSGYSGFEPTHYDGVRQGSNLELDGVFTFFRSTADLHVVVAEDAPRLQALVERQPGVVKTGRSVVARQYRLPKRVPMSHAPLGDVRPVTRATSSCPPAPILVDGSLDVIWTCAPQLGNEIITLTLGAAREVAGVRMTLGRIVEFPRQLVIETSLDGAGWDTARSGDVVSEFIEAAHARPTQPVIDVPFPSRVAAFVRLRQVGKDPASAWSLREVQVLAPAPGSR
jgi:hypothetical protein